MNRTIKKVGILTAIFAAVLIVYLAGSQEWRAQKVLQYLVF